MRWGRIKKTKCLINHLIRFCFSLCTFCFSQLPESDLIGNRFDEHDWDKISNIHVSWGISCSAASDICVLPLENHLAWFASGVSSLHFSKLTIKWSQLVKFGDLILENLATGHIWNAKYWFSCLSRCFNPSSETKRIFVVCFSLMGNVAQNNWGSFGKIGSIQASTKRNGLRRK